MRGPKGKKEMQQIIHAVGPRNRWGVHLIDRSFSSVVAWGRNLEGQLGSKDYAPVHTHPVEVVGLASVQSLAAGKTHSAAVLPNGEVWTWGRGRDCQLGHGTSEDTLLPHRVEALVGRAHVTAVATGLQHTLFLDNEGHVWSCGENKEVGWQEAGAEHACGVCSCACT